VPPGGFFLFRSQVFPVENDSGSPVERVWRAVHNLAAPPPNHLWLRKGWFSYASEGSERHAPQACAVSLVRRYVSRFPRMPSSALAQRSASVT
jgi:hypothetical protein